MLWAPLVCVAAVLVSGLGAAIAWIGPRNLLGLWRYDIRREGSYRVGDPAPDVPLVEPLGEQTVSLKERHRGRPLVLIFGSFT